MEKRGKVRLYRKIGPGKGASRIYFEGRAGAMDPEAAHFEYSRGIFWANGLFENTFFLEGRVCIPLPLDGRLPDTVRFISISFSAFKQFSSMDTNHITTRTPVHDS